MKKTIKTITIIATMGIMLVLAYWLGTTQAQTREVVADGYIPLDENIVDMNTVINFSATEYGLQLYFEDGICGLYDRRGSRCKGVCR